jgi:hypothetical protein
MGGSQSAAEKRVESYSMTGAWAGAIGGPMVAQMYFGQPVLQIDTFAPIFASGAAISMFPTSSAVMQTGVAAAGAIATTYVTGQSKEQAVIMVAASMAGFWIGLFAGLEGAITTQ